MSEVRKLGGLQEVERVMQPAVGIIMLIVFATGFIVGVLLGYGWGREDALKEHRRQLRNQNKEKTT